MSTSTETSPLLVPQTHHLSNKTILITGAGTAGLAFAKGILQFWPSSPNTSSLPPPRLKLYERDPRKLPASRGNYSIGLRSDKLSGGLQALQKLSLLDTVLAASVPNSDKAGTIRDENWEPLVRMSAPETPPDGLPVANVRITRNSVREAMIRALEQGEEGSVEMNFNVQCVKARKGEKGGMEVRVKSGEGDGEEKEVHCDLLIVADGASSKMRKALRPDDGLQFIGASLITGNAFFEPGKVPPHVQDAFGPLIGGNGTGLVVFPIDDRSAVWFVTHRSKEPRTPASGAKALEMKDEIMAEVRWRGAAYGEKFEELLQATDISSLKIFNAQDKRPAAHTNIESEPVVFIGDASHAVSPFAGNGMNMAIMDGYSLSKALCNASSIAEAVKEFDKESLPRCTKAWRISHVVMRVFHVKGIILWIIVRILRCLFWFTGGRK
ncbi:hypothetical protein CERZMDRAFT_46812 [Cercospora zeae-maydis SCOH1-5]|uniref:FAD-binding domain-containing protein n=1 Tax=Cercospora zeae-maydis SCOH1-5 TaxID=717836 RepID=A0A6A6F8J8_9PEZI|nr:hypothetical protein CERZMDRAFT_46812 [Cercospora zeae-maydis SCOH1-5]